MWTRLANLWKGFIGLFIGGIEKRNPQALLEVEKENLRKQISEFNVGLAAHAGVVSQLLNQVRKLTTRKDELRAKVKAHIQAGNQEAAGVLALQLKKVESELAGIEVQHTDSEARYKELIQARDVSVAQARDKIEELRRGIEDIRVNKAIAELNEMAAGMMGAIGGSGDNINRLSETVEQERAKALGRARVARDSVDFSEVAVKKEEQDALAKAALADFMAAESMGAAGNLTASVEPVAESGGATMGPITN